MTLSLRRTYLLPLSLSLLLAACGGGGDDSEGASATQSAAAGSVDSFVGTWKACASDDGRSTWMGVYTIEKKSATEATYTYKKETFASKDCTGTRVGLMERGGTITWDGGTKELQGTVGSKVTFKPTSFHLSGNFTFNGSPTQAYKQVLTFTDLTALHEGNTALPLDADGYPDHLVIAVYYKQ